MIRSMWLYIDFRNGNCANTFLSLEPVNEHVIEDDDESQRKKMCNRITDAPCVTFYVSNKTNYWCVATANRIYKGNIFVYISNVKSSEYEGNLKFYTWGCFPLEAQRSKSFAIWMILCSTCTYCICIARITLFWSWRNGIFFYVEMILLDFVFFFVFHNIIVL